MSPFPISSSLEDAAVEIARQGFAIYKPSSSTVHTLRKAWREALPLFNDGKAKATKSTRIIGGHLHGYNEPSPAKYLFRAFCSSPCQPWPNETFRQISQEAAGLLHQLLAECYYHIHKKYTLDSSTTDSTIKLSSNANASIPVRPNKRQRREPSAPSMSAGETLHANPLHCPLDYFFYHNKVPEAANCSEHVDRGILIAVCLTDVPGLEVFAQKLDGHGAWFCPESLIHNSHLYEEVPLSSLSGLVCIMAGDQLSAATRGDIKPCIHRVRNRLKRARMSISYELREDPKGTSASSLV